MKKVLTFSLIALAGLVITAASRAPTLAASRAAPHTAKSGQLSVHGQLPPLS